MRNIFQIYSPLGAMPMFMNDMYTNAMHVQFIALPMICNYHYIALKLV